MTPRCGECGECGYISSPYSVTVGYRYLGTVTVFHAWPKPYPQLPALPASSRRGVAGKSSAATAQTSSIALLAR